MKQKVNINIEGMTCEHCAKTVTDIITAQAGVIKVKVSQKKGTAKIKMDDTADIAQIKAAINESKSYKAL